MSQSEPRFTLVFNGDIRKLDFNPHCIDTPFGCPVRSGVGDAFAENDALYATLDPELLEAFAVWAENILRSVDQYVGGEPVERPQEIAKLRTLATAQRTIMAQIQPEEN